MNFLNFGPMELAIIGVIALVVLGPRRLPELGRMVGRWMKMVREASDEMKRGLYLEEDYHRSPPPPPRRPSPLPSTISRDDDEPAEIVDDSLSKGDSEPEGTETPSEEKNPAPSKTAESDVVDLPDEDSHSPDRYPYEEGEDSD